MFFCFNLLDSLVISDNVRVTEIMGAFHASIIGKQRALYYMHISEVVACPFMGVFEFADESAGYKSGLSQSHSGSGFK